MAMEGGEETRDEPTQGKQDNLPQPEESGQGEGSGVPEGESSGRWEERGKKGETSDKSLYILYSNVRSILNKLYEFCAYICECNPKIILICETFAGPDICDALLALAGYEMVVRKDWGKLWKKGAGGYSST